MFGGIILDVSLSISNLLALDSRIQNLTSHNFQGYHLDLGYQALTLALALHRNQRNPVRAHLTMAFLGSNPVNGSQLTDNRSQSLPCVLQGSSGTCPCDLSLTSFLMPLMLILLQPSWSPSCSTTCLACSCLRAFAPAIPLPGKVTSQLSTWLIPSLSKYLVQEAP